MARILLIENNEQSRKMLEQGLQLYGYDVVITDRGDEGLILAVTTSPDLILINIDVPGVNGWQAIKILKASKSTWRIPVIALTHRTTDGQMLLQAGFDSYDRKPLSLRHLLLKLDTLLESTLSDATPTPQPLPAVVEKTNVVSKTQECSPQRERKTVVYVDDSPGDSQLLATIVEKAGYGYANISDSLNALPLLLELKPQLIFLDLVMPVANGYELCAQIRRISVFKETPIIIVTNNDGIADRVRAKIVGASGFFGKPVQEKRILKVLHKYLQPSRDNMHNSDYRRSFLLSF